VDRSLKAQITIEFMVTVVLVIFFFAIMITVFSEKYGTYNAKISNQMIDEFVDSLKIEFDTAEVVHNGYYREIMLPDEIQGNNYSITIRTLNHNSELVVRSGKNDFVAMIPKVYGNLTIGKNIISKNGGIIEITQ
jgi:hypothetical protein